MYPKAELKELEQSLLGIVAAITQTESENVRNARLASNIAAAKITGAATSAGIFGLVSTLGTAGTGTAIGTLSGAAATNATLAWLGGLIGGGMATGALLLPAMGIAAGAAATMWMRKFFGRPRKLANLLPFEDEILFCTDQLLRPLDGVLSGELPSPSRSELRVYAHDGLWPLLDRIYRRFPESENEGPLFSETLKRKYQKRLREHCLVVEKHAELLSAPPKKNRVSMVISWLKQLWVQIASPFSASRKANDELQVSHLGSVVIAVTFQRLLEDKLMAWGLEHDLVLDALRRSTSRLNDASVEELSDYVKSLSSEQLRGVISNTKGIYHELLFVEHQNASPGALASNVMEVTNYPGADVQFSLGGEVVREVQLKAVASPALVYEHLQRYPDVEILVTEEVASIIDGIDSSGFSNAILSREVNERLHDLEGQGLLEEISDGLITSVFVTSGILVYRVSEKKSVNISDFKPYLAAAGVAVGTTSTVDGAISLAENWS